jgi:hypothetical protein
MSGHRFRPRPVPVSGAEPPGDMVGDTQGVGALGQVVGQGERPSGLRATDAHLGQGTQEPDGRLGVRAEITLPVTGTMDSVMAGSFPGGRPISRTQAAAA